MPVIFFLSTMQDCPRIPMEKTTKIIRRSIYTFLQYYQYFTTTAAVLAIPFSLSILLSQAILPSSSSLLPFVYNRLRTLFHAAGFPPSSEFFNILSLKLSQTISSSIFTLPFTLTFLLVAKASIIQALKNQRPTSLPSFSSFLSLFSPLMLTYICNSFLILSANATVFSLLFFAFNFLEGSGFSSPNCLLFLSAAGAVLYSIVLANALIISNLALVLSGMERSGGYLAILKACVLIRGKTSTALSLALPVNLVMAGIEALFQYRILRDYRLGEKSMASMAVEGMLISYLYSISVVLDTVVTCMFYKSCKAEGGSWIEQEYKYSYQVEIAEEYTGDYQSLKNSEEFP
ncbi:hypothetical protein ACOSQ2_024080 [Xanthoceras sorbifolium]|uniref:Transmembrane protein n=1 Tax=Xanthoceras sorbifolium TaxID=99658 RepID=A0ABQ8H9X6_9ROSI|nr:hypothetical protein JRO89_XS13G0253400 [Xanthoceras sorbifolium]